VTLLHLRFEASGGDDDGNNWRIHWRENPTEPEILKAVEKCRTGTGHVELEHVEREGENKPSLALQADHGRYLVLLRDGDEVEGGGDIRSLINSNPVFNPDAPRGMDYFFGEAFSARSIVTDFTLVLQAFQEFARTGNVSTKLMSYDY
jgi:hypothetical protein